MYKHNKILIIYSVQHVAASGVGQNEDVACNETPFCDSGKF